jgi:hypothetical protein
MSIETVDVEYVSGEDVESEVTPKRGRGRPGTTTSRDALALQCIEETEVVGITRDDLAEVLTGKLGSTTTTNAAYLCIYRLKRAGKIIRVQSGGKPHWVAQQFAEEALANANASSSTQSKLEKALARAEKAAVRAAKAAEKAATAQENADKLLASLGHKFAPDVTPTEFVEPTF